MSHPLDAIEGMRVGMSDNDYFADPGINNSSLTVMVDDGPEAFFRAEILCKRKPSTPAMDFGTIVHDVTLRPQELGDLYVADNPPVNPSTGNSYGKDSKKYASWHDECKQGGYTPMSDADMALASRLSRRANEHPIAGALLRASCANEVSMFHRSKRYGLTLKCKADSLILNPDKVPAAVGLVSDDVLAELDRVMPEWRELSYMIPDIKTTAEFSSFRKVCRQRKYHRAEAHYTTICDALIGGHGRMKFIVIDTMGLDRIAVKTLDHDSVHRGSEQMDSALDRIYKHMIAQQKAPEGMAASAWTDPVNLIDEELHLFAGMPGGQFDAAAASVEAGI